MLSKIFDNYKKTHVASFHLPYFSSLEVLWLERPLAQSEAHVAGCQAVISNEIHDPCVVANFRHRPLGHHQK